MTSIINTLTAVVHRTRGRLLTGAVLLTAAAGAAGAIVPAAASAAGYTDIVGTATSGSGRWSGAEIGVYQYNNGWHWLGYQTVANSAGNYSLWVPAGYEYEVHGFHQYGSCTIGGFTDYYGWSVRFFANTARVNATVPIRTYAQFTCNATFGKTRH